MLRCVTSCVRPHKAQSERTLIRLLPRLVGVFADTEGGS